MPKQRIPFHWPYDTSKYVAVDGNGNKHPNLRGVNNKDFPIEEFDGDGYIVEKYTTKGKYWITGESVDDLHLEPIEQDDFDPLESLDGQIDKMINLTKSHIVEYPEHSEFSEIQIHELEGVKSLITTAREMRDKKKEV